MYFFKLKDTIEGLQIFSFDCQKNLVVPKIPNQFAYYCKQIYPYNFTIIKGSSKEKLTKGNAHIYT